MGTWSIKPFGNDTALDWLIDLQKANDGQALILGAVEAILDKYDGCATKAEEAMAAISIISAATNESIKGTNKDAKSWINYTGFVPTYSLIDKALLAIDVITKNSELYELWEKSDSLKSWINDTNKIKSVLLNAKDVKLPKRKPKKRVMPRALYKLLEYYNINPEKKVREKIFNKIKALENVNEGNKDTYYSLPLSLVSKYGLLAEAKYLLGKGANPNTDSMFGYSPFTEACIHGHLEIAEVLLEAGAKIFGETVMDENTGFSYNPDLYKNRQETPKLKTYKYCIALFSVASQGEPRVIDYLLSKGANVHQLDLNGETLIHKACYNGNIATLKHLINLGVDVNKSNGLINGNPNSRGETALHYAVQKSQPKAVRLLLENGADPNIFEYFNGIEHKWKNTPLDFAKSSKDTEIYKLLVEFGGVLAEDL
jgi:ankyrin repeat protein